jgi:hypothetical protein
MSQYEEVMRRRSQDPDRDFSTTSPDGWGHVRSRTGWTRVPPEVWRGYDAAAKRARAFRESYHPPRKPEPAPVDRSLWGKVVRAYRAARREWFA